MKVFFFASVGVVLSVFTLLKSTLIINVYSFRFEYNNERFNNLLKRLDYLFAVTGGASIILDNLPWLAYFPYFRVSILYPVKIRAHS